MEGMNALDRAWLLALGERRAPRWVDRAFLGITHLGGGAFTVWVCGTLLALPVTRRLGLAASLANLTSHLIVQGLKRSIVRRRPDEAGILSLARNPDAFSFPSGHACAAMTLAATAAFANLPVGFAALLLALLVGMSRVYLRVHYVTDVLVGQLVGAAAAVAVSLAL
jgi:undecaprenyl-diphosphatase